MEKKKSKKKIICIIISIIIAIAISIDWIYSVYTYNKYFGKRFQTREVKGSLKLEDYDGLQRTKHEFKSNKGQKLIGYMYSTKDLSKDKAKGIVIVAHGFGGGGHIGYLSCIDYFAKHGFLTFGYDITGNDESEGDGTGGLPQGVIDLDYAISYVESCDEFKGMPIGLFGHSWGGYSTCSVLKYHPEVKAVVACSGFNRSSDLVESVGNKEVGKIIKIAMPFVKIYERLKFGKYVKNTSLDGFAQSNAKIMIIHGTNDEYVLKKYGYDIYYEKYKDDKRFEFISREGFDHSHVFQSKEYIEYIEEYNKKADKWIESLDYDINDSKNLDRFNKDQDDYVKKNLDRKKLLNSLDTELFEKMIKLYEDCMNH